MKIKSCSALFSVYLDKVCNISPCVSSSRNFSVTNSPLINISSHISIGKFVSVFCQAENLNLFCSEPGSNDVFNKLKQIQRDIMTPLSLILISRLNFRLIELKGVAVYPARINCYHGMLFMLQTRFRSLFLYDSINVFKLW